MISTSLPQHHSLMADNSRAFCESLSCHPSVVQLGVVMDAWLYLHFSGIKTNQSGFDWTFSCRGLTVSSQIESS